MRTLLLLLSSLAAVGQISPSTLNYTVAQADLYPPGQKITYTGTLIDTDPGTADCTIVDGPEPNTVWVRVVFGLIPFNDAPLSVGAHNDFCPGMTIEDSGGVHNVTINVTMTPLPKTTVTNNAGVTDHDLSNCDMTIGLVPLRYTSIYYHCEPPDRRPGGNFDMPAVGDSYTDSIYGTEVTLFSDTCYVHYASISPFNRDESRVLLPSLSLTTGCGVFDRATGELLFQDPGYTAYNGNCYFSLAVSLDNHVICLGEQDDRMTGVIEGYDVETCGMPPCMFPSPDILYTAPAPYTNVSKGGSTGSSADGWEAAALREIVMGTPEPEWSLAAIDLTTGNDIRYDNMQDAPVSLPVDGWNYIMISPDFDENGYRWIFVGNIPTWSQVFKFQSGDSVLTYVGTTCPRNDSNDNTRLRPFCTVGTETDAMGVGATHGDVFMNNGIPYFANTGGDPQIPFSYWSQSMRLDKITSTNDTNQFYLHESLGGGRMGMNAYADYAGCAKLYSTGICVSSNISYPVGLERVTVGAMSACVAGACTVNTTAPHGWMTGQEILVGFTNGLGIDPGTVATITVTDSDTFTFTAGTATGSTTGGQIIANDFLDTLRLQEIDVVRKFGANGVQIHRVADVRSAPWIDGDGTGALDYLFEPKPAISPTGKYVIWTATNGIPGGVYTLIAETGLGSPQTNLQYTGPSDEVTVTPASTSATFTMAAYPAGETSCTVLVSESVDLSDPQTLTFDSPDLVKIATGLTPSGTYYWRGICDPHVIGGSFTAEDPPPSAVGAVIGGNATISGNARVTQ